MVAFNSSLLSIKVWFSPSATSSWQILFQLCNQYDELFSGLQCFSQVDWPTHFFQDNLMKMDRVPGSGIVNHQITLITMKRNSSVSSPYHHVIVWLKFSGDSGFPPIRPSSGQLHCAPHLKVNSPIFFSLNVNSSIGVSKGIGPSTSATYHGWIRR